MIENEYQTHRSIEAYQRWYVANEATLDQRYRFELALSGVLRTQELSIHCPLCLAEATLEVSAFPERHDVPVDWRECGKCARCGMNCRLRLGLDLLRESVANAKQPKIYMSEQATPAFAWVKRHYRSSIGSEYAPRPDARLRDYLRHLLEDASAEVRHEDITRLSFDDRTFDAVASFEVLEHVPDYPLALSELRRVLVPGGTLIVSVPFLPHAADTIVRARRCADGTVEHLLDPEYHGDPVNGDGVLCYYNFGWDLVKAFEAAGFGEVEYITAWSLRAGLFGASGLFRARRLG